MKVTITMDKCLFCNDDLNPGSKEHVFLSALGGRMISEMVTCSGCNNAFSNNETGKMDDCLAESFVEVRNGLKIWTGRKAPPPTLIDAGEMENGVKFSLAPGYIPIMNKANIPTNIVSGKEYNIPVRDEAELAKVKSILNLRGYTYVSGKETRVRQKVPSVHFRVEYDLAKTYRGVAKTAVAAFVVMYGNEHARNYVSPDLRQAIRYGTHPIDKYAGFDFVNAWPKIINFTSKTPEATLSGFDHSVIITDVNDDSVAYVTLFGNWRFSVLLGHKTGLPIRGFALNPRSATPAKFIITAEVPQVYGRRHESSYKDEHGFNTDGVRDAMMTAHAKWSEESHAAYLEDLTDELMAELIAIDDDVARDTVFANFATKLATIELGGKWQTDLSTDIRLDEDDFN
jgi:hypothetical protein